MFFRKKKDNSKKESVQKRQRKLEKLEDMVHLVEEKLAMEL